MPMWFSPHLWGKLQVPDFRQFCRRYMSDGRSADSALVTGRRNTAPGSMASVYGDQVHFPQAGLADWQIGRAVPVTVGQTRVVDAVRSTLHPKTRPPTDDNSARADEENLEP